MITILDCYTDEPAGLGVPPYLGTYPRYIAGFFGKVNYIAIDDLRFLKYYNLDERKKEVSHKTNIKIYNLTKNIGRIKEILKDTTKLIVILGVHTPGKYLSALPGTLEEVSELIKDMNCEKVLTGPAVFGTQLEGGKFFEKNDLKAFDKVEDFNFRYSDIREYAAKGADIIKQISGNRIIEIETGHGCSRSKGCSFCTEPLKNKLEFREKEDIMNEIKAFYELGCKNFRLGKQSDFYLYPKAADLVREIRKSFSGIEVLHIDNVNPASVVSDKGKEITQAIVKYCTEGNIAAFGVESFDRNVFEENNLNCTAEQAFKAVVELNRHGSERGQNGMPKFLPGINILFGLKGESKKTNEENMFWLNKILKENLLLRRINIRQVSIFEGTQLYKEYNDKFVKKHEKITNEFFVPQKCKAFLRNKKYYWKWRNGIRQNIDLPMLRKLVPLGTVLKKNIAEIYDGNTTFCRQIGTYPLIVGVKERLELGRKYDLRITGHMLRSVTGIVENS